MPILDNGEPLKINHCPNCFSRKLCYSQKQKDLANDFEVRCTDCGWEGDRNQLDVEKKPF